MKEILMGYQVDSAFLPVLFSFGDEPHLAESGATNVATNKLEDGQHSKSSCGRTPKAIHLTDIQTLHISCSMSKKITGLLTDHGRYGTPAYIIITLLKRLSISSFFSTQWTKAYLNNSSQLILSLTSPKTYSGQFVRTQCDCMFCHLQHMCIIGDGV